MPAANPETSSVAAGIYNVTITDGNGCISGLTVNIPEPAVLASNVVSTTDVSCFGNSDGAIDFNVVGGVTPYAYMWSNGSTNQDLNSVAGGLYTVTVQDANGCTVVDSATVHQPIQMVVTIIKTDAAIEVDVTCNGQGNGAATASTAGGVPPYTYAWSTGANTTSIANLNIGSYDVTVTDATGCPGIGVVTITEASAFVTSFSATNEPLTLQSAGEYSLMFSRGQQVQPLRMFQDWQQAFIQFLSVMSMVVLHHCLCSLPNPMHLALQFL